MTPLEQLLKLIDSPADYKKRLTELAKATSEHDAKLVKLRADDVRIEAHYQESVRLKKEAEAKMADANKKSAENEAKSRELRAREIGVAKDESDWRAEKEKHAAEVLALHADVARREEALKPQESKLSRWEKDLKVLADSLSGREARVKEFAKLVG